MAVATSTMVAVKRKPRQKNTARQPVVTLSLSPPLMQSAQNLVSIYHQIDWDQIHELPNDAIRLYFQAEESVPTANRIWLELAAHQPEQRSELIREIKDALKNIRGLLTKMGSAGQSVRRIDGLLADLSKTEDPCRFAELCLEAACLHEETCAEVGKLSRQPGAGVKKLLPPPISASPFWLGAAAGRWMSVPLKLTLAEPIIGLCRRIAGGNTGAATLRLEPGEEYSLRLIQRLFSECQPQSYQVWVDEWPHPYGPKLQRILDAFVPELRKFVGDQPDQGQPAEPVAGDSPLLARMEPQVKVVTRTAPEPGRKTIKIKEAAEMLGVCENTVRRLIDRNKLRRVPGVRHVLIPVSEIEQFLLLPADGD